MTYVLEDGSAKQDKGYLRVLMEATTDQAGRVAHGSQMYKHARLLAIQRCRCRRDRFPTSQCEVLIAGYACEHGSAHILEPRRQRHYSGP